MPATGKNVSFTGLAMQVIENGKITEEWVYYNQLPIYSQMGYKLVMKQEEGTE
jgi:predicted ester cyclase